MLTLTQVAQLTPNTLVTVTLSGGSLGLYTETMTAAEALLIPTLIEGDDGSEIKSIFRA